MAGSVKNPFHQLIASETPEIEEIEGRSISRNLWALAGRELTADCTLGAVFMVIAISFAATVDWAATSPLLLVGLLTAFALASVVEFNIAAGQTMPIQLVLVPTWFLLPVGLIPLFVATGSLLGRLPSVLRGRTHPSRLLHSLWDSLYSVGPVVVIWVVQPGPPSLEVAWVVGLALVAQSAVNFLGATVTYLCGFGVAPRTMLRPMLWVFFVDALITPVGLAVAIASYYEPWAFALSVSLMALFAMFAEERRRRIHQSAELSSAYRGTAMLLGDVVEADDAYTGEHSRGVVELSVAVADALKLDSRQRRKVEFGALLHDVGKVAISKEIINKPGPLTPEERAIINTHTIEGQRMLDRIGGVLGEVGVVVRASHEDFDGTGYPDGLAGDEIPIEARIISCCDAYSAMTTDRSYRKGRSVDEAVFELLRCAGTQFDPVVVDTLIGVIGWVAPEQLPEHIDSAPLHLAS